MNSRRDRMVGGKTRRVGRAATRSRRCGRQDDSDRGISYVEVLVTVVLLGMAGVAVLGAAAGASKGASTQRAVADLQLVLASTADALTGIAPVSCVGAADAYQVVARDARLVQLVGDLKRGWTTANVTVTAVQSFDTTTKTFVACTNASTASAMQKVTLRVSSPDGKAVRSIDVVTAGRGTQPIGQPLTFAGREFSVISLRNARIAGTQVYGALAVGGDLTFTSTGPIAANSPGTFPPTYGTLSNVGLIVDGKVDFAASSGVLNVNNGSAVIKDMTNGMYFQPGGNNCFVKATASNCAATPRIAMQAGGNVVAGSAFDFAAAFDAYTKTSAALGALPAACADAATAVLRDQNDSAPWPGSGNFVLKLTPNKVSVLNLTTTQVNALAASNANGGSSSATRAMPLIINVTNGGSVSFNAPSFPQNYPRSVIWNFPNATNVTFNSALWGSLYAPLATVTLTADVRGVVIADTVIATGGVADWANRPDIADITCMRSS